MSGRAISDSVGLEFVAIQSEPGSGLEPIRTSTQLSEFATTFAKRNLKPVSPEGMGAAVFGATAISVVLGIISGTVPVVAGLGITQCQTTQIMALFDLDFPDNFLDYSLAYEITKFDIKFIDFIELQDSLAEHSKKNQIGHVSLKKIAFFSGNYIVNY